MNKWRNILSPSLQLPVPFPGSLFTELTTLMSPFLTSFSISSSVQKDFWPFFLPWNYSCQSHQRTMSGQILNIAHELNIEEIIKEGMKWWKDETEK